MTRKIYIFFLFYIPVSQHDPRRSSSNPRSVGYLINHTAHFNTRRNTLCAARVNEMHHEQTDSYHGLFIIGKSALEAALAQPARYYRLPPHYQATPFVPTFLPSSIHVVYIRIEKMSSLGDSRFVP